MNVIPVSSRGKELDMRPECFGLLDPSRSRQDSQEDLRAALRQDGYLFLRDMFESDHVELVRREICDAMSSAGLLNENHPKNDCVPAQGVVGNDKKKGSATLDRIPSQCSSMGELLYGARTQSFFSKLLGGEVRHYDLTWFRGVPPGLGTVPHCDVVYMGRGTHELFTMWVPYGRIPLDVGGLMILEGSHQGSVQERIRKYTSRDVDEYCENHPLPEHVDLESESDNKVWNGWLASNPVKLRKNLGGRWLTAEYRSGDALIFSCKTVHGSLDNQSTVFRLSSDCRYQLLSDPVDERFVGSGPLGHVGSAKRGRVC